MADLTDRSDHAKRCRELATQGANEEDLIAYLRAEGRQKVDTIAILSEALGIGLARAKELVHFSTTWSDVREADDAFHNELIRVLQTEDKRERKE